MLRVKMLPLLLLGLLTLAGTNAFAGDGNDGDDKNEVNAVLAAKVSLPQAIATAEQATGGKAYAANAESRDGRLFYEVMTASPTGQQRVEVDPGTGSVASTKPIATDANDGSEEEN